MSSPFISICIPAYKNIEFLRRLLDSISGQTYRNYEVILTDDSPDDKLELFVKEYKTFPAMHYSRNLTSLGTPENWNEAVRRANGEWIKLMHDDDWFSDPEALEQFAAATQKKSDFIFSAYRNVYVNADKKELIRLPFQYLNRLRRTPLNLLARNVIGPPSVTLYRKTALTYDPRMKWKVDIDYYIHYLKDHSFHYIDKPLINVGIGSEQVTQSSFLVPGVEIPENFLLLKKLGVSQLRNPLVYDSWWRLFRNLNITSVDQIRAAGYYGTIPAGITGMLQFQKKLPPGLLNRGVMSKILMLLSYGSQRLVP